MTTPDGTPLARSELDLSRFFAIANEAFAIASPDGFFRLVNPAWTRLLGWTLEELTTRPFIEFVHPDDREPTLAEFAAIIDLGKETFAFINRYQHRDGSYRTIEWTSLRELDTGMVYATARDVTEREGAETALRAARAEAERANLAKSEFLSRMSHELRTPLNAVLGFTQLLEFDELNPDQRESVHYIARAGRHLLELINEVLDLSRIEAGQLTISPEPVDVADLLDEVVALMGPLAGGRSIVIRTGDAECGCHVLADHQRLKQVLLNLVANAVKYNREGGTVSISCRLIEPARLQLRVVDSGYGIAPDDLERLFVPFERLGIERTGVEGSGMGLALSKGLIEAMGGAIGVDSELEVGTTFWVELDLVEGPLEAYQRVQPIQPMAAPPAAGRRRRILYVEDNLSNLRLVERILSRRPDLELLTAMQGRLAVELAREHHPDLILLDLHLPDVSGRDVLRQLRREPVTRAIPVVIVSADATKTQITRLTRDGATGYLTKPLDVAAFLATLDATLGAREPDDR